LGWVATFRLLFPLLFLNPYSHGMFIRLVSTGGWPWHGWIAGSWNLCSFPLRQNRQTSEGKGMLNDTAQAQFHPHWANRTIMNAVLKA